MKNRVTVVPQDHLIIVDGEPLNIDSVKSESFRALQWNGTSGHIERTGEPNERISKENYDSLVAPFVSLWENERRRIETEQLELYNSLEYRFYRLRSARDSRLATTDYLLMPDYPLDASLKEAVQIYRQALRDLPAQDGAPWDGGGEETPWPSMPELASSVSLSYANETPSGSDSDPYTFTNGMDVYSGKYYSYNNHLYLAKSDMTACVWPPDTEGLWQWELVD